MFRSILFSMVLVFVPVLSLAQSANEIYLNALDDWHDGHYPEALNAFKSILNGPDGPVFFEKIALKTGELYEVKEISEDGSNIRFDITGEYILYERTEDGQTYTHFADSESGEEIAKIEAENLIILANGSILFKLLDNNEKVQAARQSRDETMQRAIGLNDRDMYFGAMNEFNAVALANTYLYYMENPSSGMKNVSPDGMLIGDIVASPDEDIVYMTAQETGKSYSDIYRFKPSTGAIQNITTSSNFETDIALLNEGTQIAFNLSGRSSLLRGSDVQPDISGKVGIMDLSGSVTTHTDGRLVSASGSAILIIRRDGEHTKLLSVDTGNNNEEHQIISTDFDLTSPTLSPNGTRVAYSIQEQDDFEVYVHNIDGGNRTRVTRELQHDLYPTFLNETALIAAKGEGRHRRSFMYDLENASVTKLFHNNTLRTIAPEYEWAVNPDGDKILIVSERDGDTISPEQGVYLLDLNRKISMEDLKNRIDENLANELALRAKGEKLYSPIAGQVQMVVAEASRNRVYSYENALYKFDSKYISQPGNDMASEYLYNQYTSFGYSPEKQWFTPPGRQVYGGKTANVIATLRGTVNPELVYVVSSHYDSVERGPGADDNTSGTAALLEVARILADHPMPATIVFASFTGEEAGLLGSREFVRQARERGMKIVGALNNDMVGMANDSRLDNTIRYSNPGIRDFQHAAAFLFTDMVTYDALYYKFTDAHAYYEAYGDIVGGIGSYPVLGNPFYHEWNDNLETINHQLVTEVAKTTAATLMLLASSPSRLQGLELTASGERLALSWDASPESGIKEYIVQYMETSGELITLKVPEPSATLNSVAPNSEIRVKAVNENGFEGWDWARISFEK